MKLYISSSKAYHKEFIKEDKFEVEPKNPGINTIVIRTNKTYQTHMGFGGSFTDATSENYKKLSNEDKEKFINAYFSKEGLSYNLGRIPVNSTDFSLKSRIYLQDKAPLDDFDISYEEENTIPLIKRAQETSGGITFVSSPWSPPSYMKTNKMMVLGGKLKDEYRLDWAKYYARFLFELKKRGIEVNYATVQNEPEAVQVWESRQVDAIEEAYEIRDYLNPEFKKLGLDVKFLIWDHNRDNIVSRATKTLSIDGLSELVYGVGYHWYCCNRYENLASFHELYPDKHLLLTECCVELVHDSKTGLSSKAGIIEHGERYAYEIINDLNNYSEGYIDWNLLLDSKGGPNHLFNYCESPIMLDKKNSLVFNPSYYYIGHFSKFIKPGAKRVYTAMGREEVTATAYLNPDDKLVVVLLNNSSKDVKTNLDIDSKYLTLNIDKHSIITILF